MHEDADQDQHYTLILGFSHEERFISVSENNFILKKNEKRDLNFMAYAPPETRYGEYDGWIIVEIRKAQKKDFIIVNVQIFLS